MFCPSCGELALIREGDGKSYYKRIESSINPYRQEYENEKPKMEDYNPEDLSRKIPREEGINLLGKKPQIKKSDYQIDYDDWLALGEIIGRFNNVDKGEEIEQKGVKYSTCNNLYCNYSGPVAKIKLNGKEIALNELNTIQNVETREYEVITESDKVQGILTKDTYMCSKRIDGKSCDSTEVYAYVNSKLEFAETPAKVLTCKECGHGWREF